MNARPEEIERLLSDQRFDALLSRIERRIKAQTRLEVVMWGSLLIPIIGLWMRE